MATTEADPRMRDLEAKMAANHLRGQWQIDANRPQNVRKGGNGQVFIEPMPAGIPHAWRWADMQQILKNACEAMTDSYTARRALMFTNPKLQRGTVQNLVAGMQAVKAGEIAWAHRHTINALRFSIQGSEKVFTVVDGRPLAMESYDLVLTPSWAWHDHHNESDRDAIWMDALDVPFTVGMNLNFYEEPGEISQEQRGGDSLPSLLYRNGAQNSLGARPYRYPWKETLRALKAQESEPADPYHGHLLEYVNPLNGGPALPTIKCQIQMLPPGFAGRMHRSTASSIAFVIQGEGRTMFGDQEIDWGRHDTVAIPNWSWHRHINPGREAAILFTMSDSPILTTLGFYRAETEDSAEAMPPAQPAVKLSAAG